MEKKTQPNAPVYAMAGCSSEQYLQGWAWSGVGRRNVLSLLLVQTEMQVLEGKKKGRTRRKLGKMWIKYKRQFLFVVLYAMGRGNTGHSTWEKQTSISSCSNEVSKLRWISATCYSHEIASPLTSWPQYWVTPYQNPFPSGSPGKCRSPR